MATCTASGVSNAESASTIPIQHVIVIMQENRSFDHYFGTFPGANGLSPDICVPLNPSNTKLGCVKPFHDPHDINAGGDHNDAAAQFDLDDGITTDKMDGFVSRQITAEVCKPGPGTEWCAGVYDGVARHDAVGYHTDQEIPNYWAYARNFVLQDQLYAGVRSLSSASHLDLTSEWVALCKNYNKASTCTTSPGSIKPGPGVHLPWVNLFQLLDIHNVSWKYYLGQGEEPDCEDGEMTCAPHIQISGVASIWNPPPLFHWVQAKGAGYLRAHNPPIEQFLHDLQHGSLPQVSWIAPAGKFSEHPPASVTVGMEYVTSLVNAVMQSPYWTNTAIFIAWDEWGGFYDHVPPPNVDRNERLSPPITPIQGFGIRVPGIMISAYAKKGVIDHSILSLDSYATFIEDIFMGSARLDPVKLGNPDNRPDIRDALTSVKLPNGTTAHIGNLMNEFDFSQKPRPPLVLSTHIPPGITATCSADYTVHCTSPKVVVSWGPVLGPEGPTAFGYHVTRDGVELLHCTGLGTSCTDVPGSGAHLYRVYSVDLHGVASPLSAAAEADEP
jgi:phospholipase C